MKQGTQNTIAAALERTALELLPAAQEEAALEARLLVCHALEAGSTAALGARAREEMPQAALERLKTYVARRLSGEPVQYILGEWEFMGLPFFVTRDALIPRQDSETLCERAAELIRERGYGTCLDMCCGTGCIGISLSRLTGVKASLSDISPACLELSAHNANMNGVQADIILSDMFASVVGRFDIITVNPPYLTGEDMRALQRELLSEPALALYGGPDGLDFYRRIRDGYEAFLSPGGALLMECGRGQADEIIGMFGKGVAHKDILGIERVVEIC